MSEEDFKLAIQNILMLQNNNDHCFVKLQEQIDELKKSTLASYVNKAAHQVQEILNPGSLRRMERRFKQRNNQDYRAGWAPSEVVEYGGGIR